MSTNDRQYELVLLGATGYTGKLCAEHITQCLPTDLRWAVAGRNHKKLAAVVEELKSLNPNRNPPAIEIAELNEEDLDSLAKKTQLLITSVGPTGETPWVRDMVQKYHETAKANGTIMIPQCGIDSVPADITAWVLVECLRRKLSVATAEVILSLHVMNTRPSGGTLLTVFSLFDHYSLKSIGSALKPFSLSPVQPDSPARPMPWTTKLLGIRTVPDLGVLTDNPQGAPDTTIVHRSWGLYDGGRYYGPRFRFNAWMRARNTFTGVLWHFALSIGMTLLVLPPVRWLLKKLVFQPGDGPSKEASKNDYLEYRAIGVADEEKGRRAGAEFKYQGNGYYLTGLLMAEAAMVILRGGENQARKMGGGIVTPATLGEEYVERLLGAKVGISARLLDE
ncbi:hypothetical protein W97_07575 [Coniosporium apollinis CBS 100218]|uniref:Uncharacterized protein n=1 Tax=Coniosporium apollinis (strain CBS 100218) TaxID=1168221 RepID=R7Z2C0_CONA1|nr:uncharacterized protein W97_07575 [Coniosporium apollinis CBS 100218]EON68317.1 hypothetical protein W97_07575 [Coniosporium apollinis CBS 100218]